jgi:hypothetical protein
MRINLTDSFKSYNFVFNLLSASALVFIISSIYFIYDIVIKINNNDSILPDVLYFVLTLALASLLVYLAILMKIFDKLQKSKKEMV